MIKSLKTILTEKEVLVYSKQLAKANQDVGQIEAQLKEVKDDFKARASKVEAEIDILSRKVSTGEEYKEVQCFEQFNWKDGTKEIIREDSGEVVASYDITEYEKQEHMKFEKAAEDAA